MDKDPRKVRVRASAGLPVSGKVLWDGTPSAKADEGHVSVELWPLNRMMLMGETLTIKSSIPGDFGLSSLILDDYSASAFVSSPGLYVKDITYAGISILAEPLRFGAAIGNAEIRVVLARDGATIAVTVADKDRNPIPYANVAIMPAKAASPAELASGLKWGEADQLGLYTSATLAPGKYYVLATESPISTTYESINHLWLNRSRAAEVEAGAGQGLQVTVEPTKLD
jgi:hypothetical protein